MYVNAGAEIGVASTKAYTSQLIVLILIAIYFGQDRISLQPLIREIIDALRELPTKVKTLIDQVRLGILRFFLKNNNNNLS